MYDLLLSPQAIKDLEEIYNYTLLNWNYKQDEKYQDEIFDSFQNIKKHNNIGSVYFFKKGNYRKLNINQHLIFYKIDQNNCIVMRVLHQRMDLRLQLE
jgi:toxin ParE1/3/4